MKVQTYNCYNESAEGLISPIKSIKTAFNKTNIFLTTLSKLHPSLLANYAQHLEKRINQYINNSSCDLSVYDISSLSKDYPTINQFPELLKTILNYVIHTLALPGNYNGEDKEISLLYFNSVKIIDQLSYFRVKSLIELLGMDEGASLYKKIVVNFVKDMRKGFSDDLSLDPKELSVVERNQNAVNHWCKVGLANFTVGVFDDYKVICRFDKCMIPEILNEFNDSEVAYLASCFLGDSETFNDNQIIHMRRTQTLHHGEFCDEFYWNNIIHRDAEQPSLNFTAGLDKP